MAVTQVKSTFEVGAQIGPASAQAHVSVGGLRDRQGRQLAIEIDPELLQRLRQYATDNRTTMAATVRDFIAAGLQNAEFNQEDNLDGRIAWLESQVFRLITSGASANPSEEQD